MCRRVSLSELPPKSFKLVCSLRLIISQAQLQTNAFVVIWADISVGVEMGSRWAPNKTLTIKNNPLSVYVQLRNSPLFISLFVFSSLRDIFGAFFVLQMDTESCDPDCSLGARFSATDANNDASEMFLGWLEETLKVVLQEEFRATTATRLDPSVLPK